jgi:hypothetical protein
MALGFLTFVGVISVSLLSYATTNVRATVSLRQLRATELAADGAVEGAINKLRNTPTPATCVPNYFVATPGGLNNQPIVLNCAVVAASPLDVTLTAKCPSVNSSCGPANAIILSAEVKFAGVVPSVTTEVKSWSLAT